MQLSLEEEYVNELNIALESSIHKLNTILDSVIKYEVTKDEDNLKLSVEHLIESDSVSLEGFLSDIWEGLKKLWNKILEYIKKILSFISGLFSGGPSSGPGSDTRYYNVDNKSSTNSSKNKNSKNNKSSTNKKDVDKDAFKDNSNSNDRPIILDVNEVDGSIYSDKVYVYGSEKNNVTKYMEEKYQQDMLFNELVVKLYHTLADTFNSYIDGLDSFKDNFDLDDRIELDLKLVLIPSIDFDYVKAAEKQKLYNLDKKIKLQSDVANLITLDKSHQIAACDKMFGGYILAVTIDKEVESDIKYELVTRSVNGDKVNYAIDIDTYNNIFKSLDNVFKLALSIVDLSKRLEHGLTKTNHIGGIVRKIENESKNYLNRTGGKYTDKDLSRFSSTVVKSISLDINQLSNILKTTTSVSITYRRNLNTWNNYLAECRRVYVEEMNLSTKDGVVLKK